MKYEYRLLAYMHDVLREESVSVALLFHSPETKEIKFGIRNDLKNLKAIFSDFDHAHLKKYLNGLRKSFENYQSQYSKELAFYPSLENFSSDVLPEGNSVVWGRKGSGVTDNPEKTFERLLERFVSQKSSHEKNARSDDAVWGVFRQVLKSRNMHELFKPTTISLSGFKEEIEHTYQNGALHCLKPISFDLRNEENLLDKVFKIKGWHEAILESNPKKEFRFYYLLGKPTNAELEASFKNARNLLAKDEKTVLLTEDMASELPTLINQAITPH